MSNININWNGSPSDTFEVQYAIVGNPWVVIPNSPVLGLSTTLTGLTAGTEYKFRVKSTNCGDWSYYKFTTPTVGCIAPTGVVVSTIGQSTATVNWTNSTTSTNGLLVEWKVVNASLWNSVTLPINSTTYNIAGLVANTEYVIRVSSICGSGATATSLGAPFTTTFIPTLCSNIATSNIDSVTDGVNNYKVTWTNVGIPATVQIEVGLTNSLYDQVVNIISQTPTSITYRLPLVPTYPESHFIKLTPKCSDNSDGVIGLHSYVKPIIPSSNITISNQSLNIIDYITLNGVPVQPTTDIPSGSSSIIRANNLTGTPSSLSAHFVPTVQNGNSFEVKNTRNSVTTTLGFTTSVNNEIAITDNMTLLNGDIITISPDPFYRVSANVIIECINGNCSQQGSVRLNIALNRSLPVATTIKIAYGYRATTLNQSFIYGCNLFSSTPTGFTCDTFCSSGYEITIPANVTSYTSPILNCSGNSLIGAPCQPCLTPITHMWISPVASPNLLLTLSCTDASNNNNAVAISQI